MESSHCLKNILMIILKINNEDKNNVKNYIL